MSLLSDFSESLSNLLDEINSMGLGPWTGDISFMPRNLTIENYLPIIPYLSYLMVQLEHKRHLQCDWHEEEHRVEIQICLFPLIQEEYSTIIKDPRWGNSPLSIHYEDQRMYINLVLRKIEEDMINLDKVRERFNLNRKEGEYFFRESSKEIEQKSMELQNKYQIDDWPEVRRLAHGLKGTAMNLELDLMRSLANSVEKKAEGAMLEEELLREFLQCTDNVVKEINRVIPE